MSALWPLQVALFQRLSNDPSVSSLVTGVFDHIPEELRDENGELKPVAFPYVRIGEPSVLPFDTKNKIGEEISIVIHTWSQASGKKQSYDILEACFRSIFLQPLSLQGGFSIKRITRQTIQVIDDIDGKTYHGVLRLQANIQ